MKGIKGSQIRDDTIESVDIKDKTILDADINPNANIDPKKINTPWQQSVNNYSDLPLTGNRDGEIRLVKNRLELYKWNEETSEWEEVTFSGSIFNNIRETHTASAGQTQFTLQHKYKPGANNLLVFRNGILQAPEDDYEETNDNTVTFNSGLANGDIVTFIIGKAVNTFYGDIDVFEASDGQTVFNTSFSFHQGADEIDVYKNGLLMIKGSSRDYQETSEQQITFNYALQQDDLVVIKKARDYTRTGGSINKLEDLDNLTENITPSNATGINVNLGSETSPFANIYSENFKGASLQLEEEARFKAQLAYDSIAGDISTTSTVYTTYNNMEATINVKENDIVLVKLQGWFWNSNTSSKVIAYPLPTSGTFESILNSSYIATSAHAAAEYQGYCERVYKSLAEQTATFKMNWKASGGGTAYGRYVSIIVQIIGHA